MAQRDIRFARTITRLQRSIVSELEKIAVIHLYTLGYKNKDLISFKLHLNAPSKLAELQELEHWRTKFEVAGGAIEGYFSRRWVAKHIFDLSDQEIVRNQREMFYDKQLDAAYEAASMEASATDDMGGMGGMGGIGGMGEDDPASEPAAEDTEEETLLAAPGPEAGAMEAPAKRNDLQWKRPDEAPYTTPGAKGKKYTPVKSDKRDMGARKRSYKGKYAEEVGKNTPRNIWKGASELNQLAKGIYEDLETNYEEKHKEEELKILENNVEIQKIIENLEKKGKNGKKNGKVQA